MERAASVVSGATGVADRQRLDIDPPYRSQARGGVEGDPFDIAPMFPEGWPDNDPEYLRLIGVLPARVSAAAASAASMSVLDAAEHELDDLTSELVELERERADLEARRSAVLARGHVWAARHANDVVSASESPARRREVAHRAMLAEFAAATRMSERTMATHVERAVALVARGAVHSALANGEIHAGHAAVIVDELDGLTSSEGALPTPGALADFEQRLLDRARSASPGEVRRAAKRWREKVLPDALSVRHERALDERRVWIEALDDAMGCLHAIAPIDQLARIHAGLTAAAVEGRKAGDGRTIDHLRADLLIERLLGSDAVAPARAESACGGEDGHAPAKVLPSLRVLVTVPVLTLAGISEEPGQLDGFGPIPPAMARRLVAHAPSLTRVLTHPVSGAVLDVDRTSYKIPAGLRNWLIARDRTCRFPGCARRAISCDVDHTVPWEYGGKTSADNLAHLCRKHHGLKGSTGWNVAQAGIGSTPPDAPPVGPPPVGPPTVGAPTVGTLNWTSLTGRTYTTRPFDSEGVD
jgi:hypothetical protein